VVQFKILSGKMAGHERVARHFPFQIGRNAGVDLQLEDAGVWDQHFTVALTNEAEFQFETQSGAQALINGEVLDKGCLRNGDLIQIGAVEIRFGLSATRQKSFFARELLVWMGLAAISFGQVALIYWLLQ